MEPRPIGLVGGLLALVGVALFAAAVVNGDVFNAVLAAIGAVVFGWFAFMGLMAARPRNAVNDDVAAQIISLKPRRQFQHVVDLELRDGSVVRRVHVGWGRYVNWSPRLARIGFDAREVVGARQSWPLK